jgi:hypothetical protein
VVDTRTQLRLRRALSCVAIVAASGCYGAYTTGEGRGDDTTDPGGDGDASADPSSRDGSSPTLDADIGPRPRDGGIGPRPLDAGAPRDSGTFWLADGSVVLDPEPPMDTAYEACKAFERLLCLGSVLCCDRDPIFGPPGDTSVCSEERLGMVGGSFILCEQFLEGRAVDGTIRYDRDTARAQYREVRRQLTTCGRTTVWSLFEKRTFLEGTLPEGAECFGDPFALSDEACQPGLHCRSYVTEGRCEPMAEEGEVCGNEEDCGPGLFCNPNVSGSQKRCSPKRAVGGSCDRDWGCESYSCEDGRCEPMTNARSWCVPGLDLP